MLRQNVLGLTLLFVPLAHAQDAFDGTWVDLTHTLNEDAVFWPTADKFEQSTVAEGETEAGYYYSAYNFSSSEHGGTHLDAPIHFAEGKYSTDEIPLEQLIGPAAVIDVQEKVAADRDYQISVADITDWEAEHGSIADGSIVLFNTGFAEYYPDLEQYLGTAERGPDAVADLHFPGIHPDAARFLASERTIDAVGIDTASIDYGQSTLFESHVALYTENIVGLENVANLNSLPATGAEVIALPMKTEGGSGGPVRIVAYLPEP